MVQVYDWMQGSVFSDTLMLSFAVHVEYLLETDAAMVPKYSLRVKSINWTYTKKNIVPWKKTALAYIKNWVKFALLVNSQKYTNTTTLYAYSME